MNEPRRGACPGIAKPLPTGDGLLARLIPGGPVSIESLVALCDAALSHGSGVIEVTQRGSLQFRGLTPASAPAFARDVFALRLGTQQTPALLTSSLMGSDPTELVDLRPVQAELRAGLADRPALASLGPKVSVLLDGGGTLSLDDVPGDLRLRATSDCRLEVGIAGDADSALLLGVIEPQDALEVAVHVLALIAGRGPNARARALANADITGLRRSLAHIMSEAPPPRAARPSVQRIGTHQLKEGVALGLALAFGRTDAATLRRLAQLATDYGATSIETAPDRALLLVGLDCKAAEHLGAAAAATGFVVRPDDPRRFVVTCAGAPACGSARLATHQAAAAIAQAAAALLDGSFILHVSGCPKGCAHPGIAAMTFIGPDRLVMHGRAGDPPHGALSLEQAIGGLAQLARERSLPANAAATGAHLLARFGVQGIGAALGAGK